MGTQMTKGTRTKRTFWQQWNLIHAFAQRDLKSKFNATALGWLWSLVVPLTTLGIYTLVFGGLFQMQAPQLASRHEGIAIFAIWLFAGLTIWGFFQNSINAGINGLVSSGGLLQKVYFPAYAPILGAGYAVAIQSFIEVGILLAVLALLMNISWTWLLLIPFFILLLLFVASLATALAVWNIHVRDLAHLVGVFLQLLFYATPIIYQLSLVPEHFHGIPLRQIMGVLPMAEFITLFRTLVYDLSPGTAIQWLACFFWAFVSALLAFWVHRRFGADLGERI
ncbi:ABC transporter permease [Schaalia canis]|nr:ABC transporter permease [Schaalia canis]